MKIPKDYQFALLLFFSMLAVLSVLAPVDYEWSEGLRIYKNSFTKYMEQSYWEGEKWGGGDLPVTLQGLAVIFYILFESIPRLRKSKLKYRLRYLTACTFIVSLGMVHSLKNLIGRARPYKVAGFDHIHYTHWFELGDLWQEEKIISAAFPSGHTAAAFFLFAFLYAFKDKIHSKAILYLATFIVFTFTLIMAYSRVVMGDHWITDTVASVFLCWIGYDVLYNKLLKKHVNPDFEP